MPPFKMQGLSFSSLKKHPAVSTLALHSGYMIGKCDILIPLYVCIVAGGLMATLYTIRLATRSPDVSWRNKKEAEPWNEYRDKQYKFYSSSEEYSKLKSQAPKY